MIFKTFDSNIDKWTTKIGVLGKSFNDFIEASNNRKIVIDDLFTINGVPLKDAKKQAGSFWSYLYPKKEDIKNQLVDVMPEINTTNVSDAIEKIKVMTSAVSENKSTWQNLFDTLPEGEKHLAQLGQQMEGQIITTEGIIKANQQARASTLAHNEAIKAQTFSAKAGTVALKALSIAGNMLAAWAIPKVISIVAEKIDNLAHSAEHCAERVDELMSNYQSALDKANSNAKTIEDLASRYEELSKGVNNLGQNVSLTTDEYSEYNDIVNQIADMFPTMVQGYTNEGNAILSLKGNVEQLRDAYKEAQQEAYNMLIISGEDSDGNDIIENYHNTISNDNPFIKPDSTAQEYIDIINSFHEAMLTSDEAYKQFYEDMIKSQKLITEYDMSAKQFTKIKKVLDDIGFKSELSDDDKRAINNNTKAYIQTYQAEIDNALSGVRSLANAYLMTNDDYTDLDDDAKTVASLIVNSIDTELANGFEKKTDVGEYVAKIVSLIKDNPDVANALNGLFDTDFSELSYDNAKAIIDQYINTIAELTERDPIELKATLGFSDYDDNENLVNNVKEKLQDEFDDRAGELTLEDLEIAANLEIPEGALLSWDELVDKIEEAKEQASNAIEVKSFDQAWADSFTSENDKVKELSNTLLDLAEKGRLTKETFNEADSTAGDYFKSLGVSADEAVTKINALVDESKQLSSMSSQISSMAEALGTKLEDGFVSADTLAGFDVEVRGLESWDRFQEVLGSTTSSYEECQEAANALATEWVNDSNFLEQLTEQNEEYYKTQLEAMGVENYEELISYAHALNEAKEVLSQSSLELGNATYDEIEALIAEGQYSELTANMILALYDAKIAEQAATIDTAADCQNLIDLAGDADRTSQSIQLLIQLMNIYSGLESGVYAKNDFARTSALGMATAIKAQLEALANSEVKDMEIEPTVKLGSKGKSSAKSAGKDAGKSYKDGLKEELSDLEGIISSLSKAIDDQKEVITSQKEVALEAIESQISALEEERDARLEAIEAEKKALENQIKAIDKQIKAKQDEIDAINDAAKARQHEIDLQKAQYELERMQNQRTILQYSEEKGMHYVQDDSKISDAKEQVDSAKRQLEIDAIEREIDLLEESKDLLNEQIDLLEEQSESIKSFYDAQIKYLEKQKENTEKYFESLIKSIEGSKDKYQELLEIVDKAELSGKLKKLGIDEEALLNGSEEEFEKLKNAYLDVVFQLNEGNEEFLSSLRELSGYEGKAPTLLSDSNSELDTMNGKLDESNQSVGNVNNSLGETATTTSEVTSNVSDLESNLGTVNGLVSEEQTAFENLKQKINEVIEAINQRTEAIQAEQEAVGIATSSEMADFLLLKEKILEVKETLESFGTPEEGLINNIASAIQELNSISLDEGIIAQFASLKEAIDEVTTAIGSGGESSGSEGQGGSSGKGNESRGKGSEGGNGNSLTSAITEMGNTANEVIGEPEAEGDGTVIGEFGSMKTAVNDVTSAIGGGDSEGGESSGSEDDGNLIESITDLGTTTEETLGESGGDGVIGEFEELKQPIQEANEHVHGISDGLAAIDGQEVECTIKVNIETTGGLPAFASGSALDGMNLNSAEYNTQYKGNAHYEGTAKVTGDWGVRAAGKALVGELGQEIVVSSDGKWRTVGDNGAEFVYLKENDIVFNHLQTKELLSKGNLVGRGRALADGTAHANGTAHVNGTVTDEAPHYPSQEILDFTKRMKKLEMQHELIANYTYGVLSPLHDIKQNTENMISNISSVSNVTNNNKNVQQPVVNHISVTLPNVTNSTSAESLLRDLESLNTKKYQVNW